MTIMKKYSWLILSLVMLFIQGCIHEYPHPVKGNSDKGEVPTAINTFIEVSYNLSWESILHQIDFDTKSRARDDRDHRFIIEVIKEGEIICHDIQYLSSEDFSLGKLSHKLSMKLEADYYQIAVWYDLKDEKGIHSFSADALNQVSLINLSTQNSEVLQCAYATDGLDLTDYEDVGKEITVEKPLQLQHAGARFEIVATDVQKFITNNKASLNQGDSFTVHLSFSNSTPIGYNLHSDILNYTESPVELSGELRLPFAEYEELKIAEGFIFCLDEENVSLNVAVKNSALVLVSQTDYFKFPVKRGHITTVYGDFLTHTIDGNFTINNIWDGEIVMEI